jgi:hypothetical protein
MTTHPPEVAPRRRRPARVCQLVAAVLALAAGAVVAFAPLAREESQTATSSGSTVETRTYPLSEDLGLAIVLVVAIPVVITLLPLLVRGRAYPAVSWLAAGSLLVLCVLALFSVGVLYLPAALTLVVAAAMATVKPRQE